MSDETFRLACAHDLLQGCAHTCKHSILLTIASYRFKEDAKQSPGLMYLPLKDEDTTNAMREAIKHLEQECEMRVEFELIRITGRVPLHFHKNTGGAVIRLDTEPTIKLHGMLAAGKGRHRLVISPGQSFIIPAGTVHGFSFPEDVDSEKRFVHLLAINTPPLAEDDIPYV